MTTTVVSTIRSSGGDYTTLSAWEAGEQKNLTTADEISVAECYDDWGSGLSDEVNISGWTVDATRYIKVTVASGHRHNGTPQSGFFIRKSSTGSSVVINQHPYTVLEWLDVEQTSGSSGKYAIRHFGSLSGTPVTQNCIAKNASSDQPAFVDSGSQTFISCLAWGGYAGFSNAGATKAYNCIAANCTTGFGGTGGAGTAYNCIAYNNTTNWANGWKAGDYGSNNATSTGSDDAPGGSSVYGITSGNFVNAASNDFHLASGTNSLVGAGINKYSVLTTDIDGDTWPSSGAWDIGFDYYVASGPIIGTTSVASDLGTNAANTPAKIAISSIASTLGTTSSDTPAKIAFNSIASNFGVDASVTPTKIVLVSLSANLCAEASISAAPVSAVSATVAAVLGIQQGETSTKIAIAALSAALGMDATVTPAKVGTISVAGKSGIESANTYQKIEPGVGVTTIAVSLGVDGTVSAIKLASAGIAADISADINAVTAKVALSSVAADGAFYGTVIAAPYTPGTDLREFVRGTSPITLQLNTLSTTTQQLIGTSTIHLESA